MRTRFLSFLFLSTLVAAPLQGADRLAIKGGRIITMTGEVIENGTLLVEDGRITGVGGADLEVPWDAEVIDATGKVVFPGLVLAHTSESLDRANENVPVTPFLSVLDALDPMSPFYENAIRGGITTIHVIPGNETVIGGKGMIVKPNGLSVEAMTVKPLSGMKIAVAPKRGANRMSQMAELRRTFAELRAHLRDEAEKKRIERIEAGTAEPTAIEEGKEIDPFTILERDDLDVKRRDLYDLIRGRMPVFLHCEKAMDVAPAVELAEKEGFLKHTVLVIAAECYKAADLIKEKGLSVILPSILTYREQDPLTGEEEEVFLPDVMREKGIPYALSIDGSNSFIRQSLLLQAAFGIRMGLERAEALKSITTTPASILGLTERVGTLEVGKDANVLLLSGDPLDSQTWVEEVILEGRRAYSKATDQRLQKLIGEAVDGGK